MHRLLRPLGLFALSLILAATLRCESPSPAPPSPPASEPAEPITPAVTQAPFDVGAVIRQVRLAFREEGGRYIIANYAVEAADGGFSVTPAQVWRGARQRQQQECNGMEAWKDGARLVDPNRLGVHQLTEKTRMEVARKAGKALRSAEAMGCTLFLVELRRAPVYRSGARMSI